MNENVVAAQEKDGPGRFDGLPASVQHHVKDDVILLGLAINDGSGGFGPSPSEADGVDPDPVPTEVERHDPPAADSITITPAPSRRNSPAVAAPTRGTACHYRDPILETHCDGFPLAVGCTADTRSTNR